MQIKTVKPINFLFFRTETKLTELQNFFFVADELFKEAVQTNLSITGPIHWHYFGFEGDPNKPFTLEIALPVSEVDPSYDGKFHFKRADEFKCATAIHNGSWTEMTNTYGMLMEFISAHQFQPNGLSREIYINADFQHLEANITEIQIGLN